MMKAWKWFLKVLATLAAVAGVAYVIVKYGDKIVAWTRRTLNRFGLCCCDDCEEFLDEEIAQEKIPAEDVAEESDFEAE